MAWGLSPWARPPSQGHPGVPTEKVRTLAISFESEISLSAKDTKDFFSFFFNQRPIPRSVYSYGPFFKSGKLKQMLCGHLEA